LKKKEGILAGGPFHSREALVVAGTKMPEKKRWWKNLFYHQRVDLCPDLYVHSMGKKLKSEGREGGRGLQELNE